MLIRRVFLISAHPSPERQNNWTQARPAMWRRGGDVEAIASQFRERIGISECVFVDGLTLLQKLKRHYGVDHVGVDSLPPNSEGEFDDEKKVIRLPNAVLAASYWADPRARMTIAHEAAHVALGHKGIVNRSTKTSRAETLSAFVARQESEAKRLAAAILAPFKFVEPNMSADEIAFRFGISRMAAKIRLNQFIEFPRGRIGEPRDLPSFIVELKSALSDSKKVDSLQFADPDCPNCGRRSLICIGTKLLCVKCDAILDRTPD